MRNPELTLTHPSAKKKRLLAVVEQIPGAWVGLKIAALLLVLEGQPPGWICEVLGVTRMSLGRWIHGMNAEGIESLKPKAIPGRPSQLSRAVAKVLQKQLDQSPQLFGLNRARWDGPTLVRHLQRQFGITLKVRQAQQWMHQLGYRMKRASYSYLQAKSAEAEQFRRGLKKTPLPEEE
jgi:transposase